jgi:hypothetical protein
MKHLPLVETFYNWRTEETKYCMGAILEF